MNSRFKPVFDDVSRDFSKFDILTTNKTFFQLSTRYNFSSNNAAAAASSHVDLFEHLQSLFENAEIRYPNFSQDFLRILQEHLAKTNSSETTGNTQLTSGVVKLRI